MSKKEENITTKFSVDITEFKSGIQEANRLIKLANSEFKAISSSMNDWSKSTDGLQAKINQLNKVLSAEEQKLQALKKQHELIVKEQGENSSAAQNLEIKINNQQAAVNKVANELNKYNIELNEIKKSSNIAEQSIDNLNNSFNETVSASQKLKDEISKQENTLESLKQKYIDIAIEQGKNSNEANELTKEISNLSKELNNNKSILNDLGKYINSFSQEINTIDNNIDEANKSISSLSNGFTIVKSTISNLVADGIKSLASSLKELIFEVDNASAIFQGMTGTATEEMSAFNEEIKKIYNSGIGESLDDVAQAMAEIKNQTGEIDPTKLSELTTNALHLNKTFGYDVNESIRSVNMLVEQFGITSEQAFNLIVQGAQSGLDKNGDLLDTINEYSVKFADSGDSAEDFFNRLKNSADAGSWSIDKSADAFKEFTVKTIEGSDDAVKALDRFGINWEVAARAISKGGEAGREMTEKIMNGLMSLEDPLAQNVYGTAIFGTMWEDTGAKALLAMSNTKGEIDATKNSMQELANTNIENLSTQWSSLGRTLKNELITPIISELKPSIENFINWAIQNLPIIEKLLIAIGIAIGTVFITNQISTFITSLTNIKNAITGLKIATDLMKASQISLNAAMLANPIGIIIGLIAALVAGLIYLWNTNEDFRNFIISCWESIKDIFSKTVEWICKKFDDLKTFFTTTMPQSLESLKQKFNESWENIKNKTSEIWQSILDFLSSIINNIVKFFTETIPKAIELYIQAHINLWKKIIEIINKIWEKFIEWGKKLLNFATTTIPEFINKIIEFISQLPSKIWEWLKQTFEKVVQWGKDLINKGKEISSKLVDNIINGVKELPSKLFEKGKNAVSKLWDGIISMGSWLKDKVSGFFSSIFNNVKTSFVNDTNNNIKSSRNLPAFKYSTNKSFNPTNNLNNEDSNLSEIGNYIPNNLKTNIFKNLITTFKNNIDNIKNGVIESTNNLKQDINNINFIKPLGPNNNNITFNQYNSSPKALSRMDIYKQTRGALFELKRRKI